MMFFTFHTMMVAVQISSTPPVQAPVQPQAIGTKYPLTQQVRWAIIHQWPSIPMVIFTFHTLMIPIKISSMQHVQAPVQPQAIGTKYPLTQQVPWGISPQSLSTQTMLCTSPTSMLPMTILSMPHVQAVARRQAIGTLSHLSRLVLLFTTQKCVQILPSIPMMVCIFPTLTIPMTISSMPHVQAVAQPQAIGTRYP